MMKMSIARILLVVFLPAILIVAASSFYTVSETEQVIITQFGKPKGEPVREAGLPASKTPRVTVTSVDATSATKLKL